MIALDAEYENSTGHMCDQTVACMKLWVAVAELAISDFRKGGHELKRSAVHYLFMDKSQHVGSFTWICTLFGKDVNVMREILFPGWRRDILKEAPKPQLHVPKRKPDFKWTPTGVSISIPSFGEAA